MRLSVFVNTTTTVTKKKWAKKQKKINVQRNRIEIFKSSLLHDKRKWRRWRKTRTIIGKLEAKVENSQWCSFHAINSLQSHSNKLNYLFFIVYVPCNVCQLPYAIWKTKTRNILIRLIVAFIWGDQCFQKKSHCEISFLLPSLPLWAVADHRQYSIEDWF